MLACMSTGRRAKRSCLCSLAVQPEELQWPWPEINGSPGGTRRLSADAAAADAGARPATAGSLRASTKGEADPAGLQLGGSSRREGGRQPLRPQTAGNMRVRMLSSQQVLAGLLAGTSHPVPVQGWCMKSSLAALEHITHSFSILLLSACLHQTGRRLTSRRPGSAPALPNLTDVDAKLVQMALPGMGGSPTKRCGCIAIVPALVSLQLHSGPSGQWTLAECNAADHGCRDPKDRAAHIKCKRRHSCHMPAPLPTAPAQQLEFP